MAGPEPFITPRLILGQGLASRKARQAADFDARDWVAPKLLGAYGCAPWGEMTVDTGIMSPLCTGRHPSSGAIRLGFEGA